MKKGISLSALFLIGMTTLAHGYYYEKSTPHNGTMKTGTDTTGIVCSNCHNAPIWGTGTSQPYLLNIQCESCHNKVLTYDASGKLIDNYSKTAAPLVRTHSANEVAAAGGGARFGNWAAACWDCHRNHSARPNSIDAIAGGTYVTSTPNATAGTTIFTIKATAFTAYKNAVVWGIPNNWSKKSGDKRGLILYVGYDDGSAPNSLPNDGKDDDFESFEIEAISQNSGGDHLVTVKGLLNKTDTVPLDFELFYGQLMGAQITRRSSVVTDSCFSGNDKACATAYDRFTGPEKFPFNENSDPKDPGIVLGNDPTPNSICQICHTATKHWLNNGTNANHFNGMDCASCHDHTVAWLPDPNVCTNCHGDPPVDLYTLVKTPGTNSLSAGMHKRHVDRYALTYGDKVCQLCHFGGMPETPGTANYTDSKIQMGFGYGDIPRIGKERFDGRANLSGAYTYAGTNGTTITQKNQWRCYNVYCHGPGRIQTLGYEVDSFSPKWDGSEPDRNGGTKCDNCHGFPPRWDNHNTHNQLGFKCQVCHYATTTDGVTINNHGVHTNGKYEVVPAPGEFYRGRWHERLEFSYIPGSKGGTCTNNFCHYYYRKPITTKWVVVDPVISATFSQKEACTLGKSQVTVTFSVFPNNNIVSPYNCTIDWGDGLIDENINCTPMQSNVVHTYSDGLTSHTVKWTLRDTLWATTGQQTTVVTRTCPF